MNSGRPARFALLALGSMLFPTADATEVTDVGVESGFQDFWGGYHKRGRASVAADFDLDGRVDFYIGNPGDESFVIRNVTDSDGQIRFQLVQTLLRGELAWGAASADYDNDGDYDVFVSNGANEGIGFDRLFRNLWMENGQTILSFEDVTEQAGVAGPISPSTSQPLPVASANAVWGDVDRDGDVDLFVSVNIKGGATLPELEGRNILWLNNGDGTFTDITDETGLGATFRRTRHSTFLDIDNDGDLDLYENNYNDLNVLWRNQLVETGSLTFEDVSSDFAGAPGEDLRYPFKSFVSETADFNNDDWQDLIVFQRARDTAASGTPYDEGHAIFMNRKGTGFVNVAAASGINDPLILDRGVMGCQVGDVTGDGLPDVYFGNGAPMNDPSPNGGQVDLFFVSAGLLDGKTPLFDDASALVNFPAPEHPNFPGPYPPYPYRTHGTNFVDVDNDGTVEITVTNGGPASMDDSVREPNRLFKLSQEPPRSYLKIRPVGNGTTVSKDAIGTRIRVTATSAGGSNRWAVTNTLLGGSCFSAQNGFELYFGLNDADSIESLEIVWPDGNRQTITEGLEINKTLVIAR